MEGNPDDIQLVNQLDRTKTDAWEELRSIAKELTTEDRNIKWTGSGRLPDGTYRLSYPAYSERVRNATKLLSTVGAVTPLYYWMEHGLPDYSSASELSVADAIRTATFVVRGERFSDGTIAYAAEEGLLDAILNILIKWYEME
ncbi:hypothetical protein JOC86_004711 [Bacillus pakistanensis]|uniref:Uncharacterized protein n=1 Tax=Rossellomorea pakistanensis TaxID=992288 RepID=A0ABS2NJU3_9BACI|nr:DUF6508 domain-containing protein [Bacillus pakistanensis]MBM7588136.1 hypothetical protein [Bacillus pakistanensis]